MQAYTFRLRHTLPLLATACLFVASHTMAFNLSSNTQDLIKSTKVQTQQFSVAKLPVTSKKAIQVSGTLGISQPEQAGNQSFIELAERRVYLLDLSQKLIVAETKTQLNGNFYLSAPSVGKFQLCWDITDLDQSCGPRFAGQGAAVSLGLVKVFPQQPYAWGTTLMQEARPCWLHDPYFEINLYTRVELFSLKTKQPTPPVKANTQGEYAIGLPPGDKYMIRSTCEKTITQTTQLVTSGYHHIDLPLDNWVPTSGEMAAYDNNTGVTRADINAELDVVYSATDRDNHKLTYQWKVLDGSGNTTGSAISKEQWTLPGTPGRHQLYAAVSDGYGGYLLKSLALQVGVPELQFSGTVIDEVSRLPVANAHVDVLGEKTTTNSNGWFKLEVSPAVGMQRYPLNINHRQYAAASRVHDQSSRGGTYELIRAQISQHDPSQPIDIVDRVSSGPCGFGQTDGKDDPKAGALIVRADQLFDPAADQMVTHTSTYQRELAQTVTQNSTGKRQLKPVIPDRECRRRGARLQLPANALVYPDQTLAQGPITLAMATINPERRAMVGDYRAIDAAGSNVELTSFGALYAEFRDKNGDKVNVRQGMAAKLTIPVSDSRLPIAKQEIDMWSYDQKTGFWVQEQVGKLGQTNEGPAYIGETTHFSTINMDVAGSDPAGATCVSFELGATLSAWDNLVIRAYVPIDGGTGVQVKETPLNNDTYHAIYRIPYSNPPAGNTLRLELRGELPSGDEVVLLDDIIQTDLRPKMTGLDLWPPYPYTECGDPIVLEADPVNLPYYGDIDATGRPAFLTGPYGTYLPVNGLATATAYYDTIDPANLKTDLASWWTANGFGVDGSGGTRASYLNHNDLGFGRDMHCLGDNQDYACYVTNYGLPDQNPSNADDAETQNEATQGATVTMEYHAALGDTAVSFYAYNGGLGSAQRIKFADLDGLGPKPIPQLCMVCHGGEPGSFVDDDLVHVDGFEDNLVHDAKFREFDLPTFRYSGNRSWEFPPAVSTLNNTELDNFEVINNEVSVINPGNKISALIDAWYSGGGNTPQELSDSQVPVSWQGDSVGAVTSEDAYRDLYAPSCRACHIARSGIVDTFNSFKFSSFWVCEQPKVMPNAYITYKNFWSDLIRVNLFEVVTGTADCFD